MPAGIFSADARHFAADVYLGFVFWTVLTSLGMCIWYFPLWHMGISGYEAALFADMSPILLSIPPLRRLLTRHRWLSASLALAGIAAYRTHSPVQRLMAVAAGTAGAVLWWLAPVAQGSGALVSRERSLLAWEAGLVSSVAVRMWFQTNNPAWPTVGRENGGLGALASVLGVLAVIDTATRRSDENAAVGAAKKMDARFVMDSEPRSTGKAPWVRTGLGLGALLFALHSMYADSATVARWAWDGYPRTGPAPVPWGALVLGALGGGFVLGHRTKLARSWLWWTAGATGAALVTCVSGWAGFSGALVLGVYLSSISRTLLHSAASARAPGRTLGLALFWYNVLVLAHVWVVAYEFVPAGDVLRERTWVVMAFTMGSLLLAVRAGEQQSKQSTEHSNHGSLRLLAAADRRRARHVVAGAVVAGCLAMVWRLPAATHTPTPYHSEHRMLTAGIWTVHFDLDNDMWVAEDRIIKAVRDLEVDVMGFLESDTERIIMGGRDWTQRLGEELGYYIDYGPSPRKHTWGCAMASKFPILRSTHHLLPSPVGELACAIHATLDVYGREIDVIVSHNGQEENALDRRLQTGELARIMRESPNPMIFTGYVVTKPHARNYRLLYEKGNISDVDPTDSDRWCQYIGYRGLNRTAYARVSRGTVTDTEIQLAKFVVPDTTTASKNTDGVEDSWKPSYVRVAETDYTPAMRFPDMFKGKGVRGHFYHVFKEPRYFA